MTDMDRAVEQAAAAVMPFECWEQLPGETGAAYAAFRVYRDLGFARTIRKAAICYANRSEFDGIGGVATEQRQGSKPSNSTQAIEKRYRVWRNWSTKFRWRERAGEYDRYTEKLKAAEMRKSVEAQGEKQRNVANKMLDLVEKKLDTMNPAELPYGAVPVWVDTSVRVEREVAVIIAPNDKSETKQGEFPFFEPDFNGL